MVNHFNILSGFFNTWILSGSTPKQRGYYIRYSLGILAAAVDIQNYHLVFAIIASLGASHFFSLFPKRL
jgi:hypothetical protein